MQNHHERQRQAGPSEGRRQMPGEGPGHRATKPARFSAKKKTEIVLRLLRGEAIELLSREFGVPASRLSTWRARFLDAGQASMQKQPALERDRELSRLREKLGESTMELELLHEKIDRLEAGRPLGARRSRR